MEDEPFELDDKTVKQVLLLTGDLHPTDSLIVTRIDRERVAANIRNGTHRKGDAKKLMDEFVRFHESGDMVPPDLLRFVNDSFATHLNEGVTLDVAFGVKLERKQPPVTDEQLMLIAIDIWRMRVEGKSYEEAIADQTGYSKSVVEKAWKRFKDEALIHFRADNKLSESDEARIIEIVKKSKSLTAAPVTPV